MTVVELRAALALLPDNLPGAIESIECGDRFLVTRAEAKRLDRYVESWGAQAEGHWYGSDDGSEEVVVLGIM